MDKLIGPYLFSPTSRETLGEKMELYFHDHAIIPLFMQVCTFSPSPLGVVMPSHDVGELPQDLPVARQQAQRPRTVNEATEIDGQGRFINI